MISLSSSVRSEFLSHSESIFRLFRQKRNLRAAVQLRHLMYRLFAQKLIKFRWNSISTGAKKHHWIRLNHSRRCIIRCLSLWCIKRKNLPKLELLKNKCYQMSQQSFPHIHNLIFNFSLDCFFRTCFSNWEKIGKKIKKHEIFGWVRERGSTAWMFLYLSFAFSVKIDVIY